MNKTYFQLSDHLFLLEQTSWKEPEAEEYLKGFKVSTCVFSVQKTCFSSTYLRTAPIVKPTGRLVGKSFKEWTTRSTLWRINGIIYNDTKQPQCVSKHIKHLVQDKAIEHNSADVKNHQRCTYSFLSKAFSNSFVKRLFSPIFDREKNAVRWFC